MLLVLVLPLNSFKVVQHVSGVDFLRFVRVVLDHVDGFHVLVVFIFVERLLFFLFLLASDEAPQCSVDLTQHQMPSRILLFLKLPNVLPVASLENVVAKVFVAFDQADFEP